MNFIRQKYLITITFKIALIHLPSKCRNHFINFVKPQHEINKIYNELCVFIQQRSDIGIGVEVIGYERLLNLYRSCFAIRASPANVVVASVTIDKLSATVENIS